ncbi:MULTISPECIES: hypothetical protein [unclassified Mycobacterium]|uniref:hypothetical protein n=1 Tax=unclassified Mycobacterium TaxID=2642494 RepID=UPI001CD9B59F|nr:MULTISPECIES: hypothetical protein [unclassified Mycobacterium]
MAAEPGFIQQDFRADRLIIRDLPKPLVGQPDSWANMSRHVRSPAGPLRRVAKLRA